MKLSQSVVNRVLHIENASVESIDIFQNIRLNIPVTYLCRNLLNILELFLTDKFPLQYMPKLQGERGDLHFLTNILILTCNNEIIAEIYRGFDIIPFSLR